MLQLIIFVFPLINIFLLTQCYKYNNFSNTKHISLDFHKKFSATQTLSELRKIYSIWYSFSISSQTNTYTASFPFPYTA